jgi:succinyl-diaminopimelate desuccinylase
MEKDLCKKINLTIEKNFDEQIEFLQKLVRTKSSNPFTPENSFSDNPIEIEVAKLIKQKLEEFGLSPEFKGISSNRPNVICEIKGDGEKTLILNGHMDTIVPPENYSFDPYGGEIKNGKLLGVGSADMKASLSIFVYVAKALINLDLKLKGNLILTFVVDEEPGACSKYGTQYLLEHGLRGNAAIVAEPGTKKICIGHRGGYRFKLITLGESVHTGISEWERKEKGKNAIIEMAKVIHLLQEIEIPFNPSSTFPNRKPVFSFPTKIAGGQSINVIPDKCESYGDVRLLPNNTPQQIKEIIAEKLDKASVNYQIQDILSVPAVEISPAEKIVGLLSKHSKDILENQPILEGAGPWNDGWMFISRGIPAICGFGPDGEGVHSQDECVYFESLRKITEIYLRTIIDFLEIRK